MMRSIFGQWLRDNQRGILGWTVAIVLVGCAYAAFWPIVDDPELLKLLESYPQAMLEALNYTDFATAPGYLDATVYGLLGALLMLVYSITAGARTVAGDEEAGTLELVLAHPVSRASLALQRFGAFVVSVLVIMVAFSLAIALLAAVVGLDGLTLGGLAAMHLHLAAFATLFGSISFAVGAATGRRALALGVAAAVGVLEYAMRGLIPQVEGLDWVSNWSAFTWLNGSKPLEHGLDWRHLGLLLGIAALLVALGTWSFTRRDTSA
jgi:ABC-2 type transport system permease protein